MRSGYVTQLRGIPLTYDEMVAWLSSSTRSVTARPSKISHNCKSGETFLIQRVRHFWRLLTQASGKKVLGPCSTRNPPDVDLPVRRSPAKSASTYKRSSRCSGSSSIVPTKRYWGVELIYCMSLQNLLSSPWTKTVLLLQGR